MLPTDDVERYINVADVVAHSPASLMPDEQYVYT
jgi:hypothetical protein